MKITKNITALTLIFALFLGICSPVWANQEKRSENTGAIGKPSQDNGQQVKKPVVSKEPVKQETVVEPQEVQGYQEKQGFQEGKEEDLKGLQDGDQQVREGYLQFKNQLGVWDNLSVEQQEKYLGGARNYLLNTIDKILVYLERIQVKVMKMERFSEERKEEILSQEKEHISWFELKKGEVEDISSPEEFRNLAQELKQYWSKARIQINRSLSSGFQYRFEQLFQRMAKIQERAKKQLETKKGEGKDVGLAESLMEQFASQFELAQQIYNQAKEKYANANEGEDFQAQYQEGNKLLKQVHEQLKEAYGLLKQIIKELKEV